MTDDQWQKLVDDLYMDEDKQKDDDYCDCHERCEKCGKKLRPWREPVYPYVYPHPQPIWIVEPYRYYYGDNTVQITWDSNSGL
jgi:hypothetical protein